MATTATITLAGYLGISRTAITELAVSPCPRRARQVRFEGVDSWLLRASKANYRADDISREARAASAGLKQSQRELIERKVRRESGLWCLKSHVSQQWGGKCNEFRAD